jgi:hypothetical protein
LIEVEGALKFTTGERGVPGTLFPMSKELARWVQ